MPDNRDQDNRSCDRQQEIPGKLRKNLQTFFENGITTFEDTFLVHIVEDISNFISNNDLTSNINSVLRTIINNIWCFMISRFYRMAAWDKTMSDPFARNS